MEQASFNFAKPKLLAFPGSLMANASRLPADRYFLFAVAAAFLLHAAGLYAWHLVPKTKVIDIPVLPLNIKLGDGETLSAEEIRNLAPDAPNDAQVERTLAALVKDAAREAARADAVTGSLDKAMENISKAASAEALESAIRAEPEQPRQFVRAAPEPAAREEGQKAAGKTAEVVLRYEQMISLWIQKFKLYPEEARKGGMEGETVIRVRIDRHGNIRHYMLERSTGYSALDRAAIDMIRRSNPVPAVPADYPAGELLEFLIPVNFRLQ